MIKFELQFFPCKHTNVYIWNLEAFATVSPTRIETFSIIVTLFRICKTFFRFRLHVAWKHPSFIAIAVYALFVFMLDKLKI